MNETNPDYENSRTMGDVLRVDYITHYVNVSDYRILSSNTTILTTLGIRCVPQLKDDVEVSLK